MRKKTEGNHQHPLKCTASTWDQIAMVDDQKVIDWKYDEKAPQKLGTQTCFTSRKKTPRKKKQGGDEPV